MFFNHVNLSGRRKAELLHFQKQNQIKFKNLNLLELACIHRSFSNENSCASDNNERLEFLGDAVLGMSTASYLYEIMMGHAEGDLAKIKSIVVSEATLASIALEIGIDGLLLLGRGEELSGGRKKKAILADAVEALIGALYLDSGFKTAEKFVLSIIVPEIEKVLANKHQKDYKTLLQELCQKKFKECPVYTLTGMSGPDHDRTFKVSVSFNHVIYGPEEGKNKKEAEQAAARSAWAILSGSN